MRSAVTAASRLRAEVLQMEGLILIVNSGRPDKVIQVNPLPDYLSALREEQRSDKRPKKFVRDDKGREFFETMPANHETEQKHVELNLMRMPHQEAFKLLEREIHLRCPRDRALPAPLSVAESLKDEWSVMPEDVPSVSFADVLPEQAERTLSVPLEEIASFQCSECDANFPKKQGLLMHIRHRHPQKAAVEALDAKKAAAKAAVK